MPSGNSTGTCHNKPCLSKTFSASARWEERYGTRLHAARLTILPRRNYVINHLSMRGCPRTQLAPNPGPRTTARATHRQLCHTSPRSVLHHHMLGDAYGHGAAMSGSLPAAFKASPTGVAQILCPSWVGRYTLSCRTTMCG